MNWVRACVFLLSFVLIPAVSGQSPEAADTRPLRLAIVGLVHGHVGGFLRSYNGSGRLHLAGIFEPDTALQHQYAKQFSLPDDLFFTDLPKMLEQVKPEAVAAFTNTYDHAMVVKACAQRHIHVMMEKPLAVTMQHAREIQHAADAGRIHVIVNYETTWYRSHGAMWDLIKQNHAIGDIRKMVAMDGHQGPKEIHVGPEFFAWLTVPVKNGAGALFDFGCYGANLMTWMMDNRRPVAVTAITQHIKPAIYQRVEDEANVLVQYPEAQGIIQGSWNWPFSRKDFEVYGANGYATAIGGEMLQVRLPASEEEKRTPAALPAEQSDSLTYLTAVVRGRLKPSGLSSLENNMIVTEILVAARESARTGKTVRFR